MAVAKLKKFSVVRKDETTWDFLLGIEDDSGGKLWLTAVFEDLDQMVAVLDEQLNAIVDAAEKMEAQNSLIEDAREP